MSQHHLEEYFKQNREAFDEAIPSLKVWADIDNQLDEKFKRHRPLKVYLRIAAAILVLVVAGSVMKNFVQKESNSVAVLPPEVKEAESFYQQQFQKKYAQLVSLPHDAAIGAAINADLEKIDETLAEIKKEFEHAPKGAEERILESLIDEYKLRIQLINIVLERIKEDKPLDEKTVKNESISI